MGLFTRLGAAALAVAGCGVGSYVMVAGVERLSHSIRVQPGVDRAAGNQHQGSAAATAKPSSPAPRATAARAAAPEPKAAREAAPTEILPQSAAESGPPSRRQAPSTLDPPGSAAPRGGMSASTKATGSTTEAPRRNAPTDLATLVVTATKAMNREYREDFEVEFVKDGLEWKANQAWEGETTGLIGLLSAVAGDRKPQDEDKWKEDYVRKLLTPKKGSYSDLWEAIDDYIHDPDR